MEQDSIDQFVSDIIVTLVHVLCSDESVWHKLTHSFGSQRRFPSECKCTDSSRAGDARFGPNIFGKERKPADHRYK